MIFRLSFVAPTVCGSPSPASFPMKFVSDEERVRLSGIIPSRLSVFDEVDSHSEDELQEKFMSVSHWDVIDFEVEQTLGLDRLSSLMDNLRLLPPIAIPDDPSILMQQARLRALVVPVFTTSTSPEPSTSSGVSRLVTLDSFVDSYVEDEVHPSHRPVVKRRLPLARVREEETLHNSWAESEFVEEIPCVNVRRRIDYFVTGPRAQRRIREDAFHSIDDTDDESENPCKKWKVDGTDIIFGEPSTTTV